MIDLTVRIVPAVIHLFKVNNKESSKILLSFAKFTRKDLSWGSFFNNFKPTTTLSKGLHPKSFSLDFEHLSRLAIPQNNFATVFLNTVLPPITPR